MQNEKYAEIATKHVGFIGVNAGNIAYQCLGGKD